MNFKKKIKKEKTEKQKNLLKKEGLSSDPRRIRTFDLLLRRQLLYPAELWNHFHK